MPSTLAEQEELQHDCTAITNTVEAVAAVVLTVVVTVNAMAVKKAAAKKTAPAAE